MHSIQLNRWFILTQYATSIICIVTTLCTLGLISLNLDRGFDITDESIYILSSQYPELVGPSTSRFGYYTGILYSASLENLKVFRFLGVSMLALASLQLYRSMVVNLQIPNSNLLSGFALLSTIVSSCLVYYSPWVMTPSYNWMALIAAVIVASSTFSISRYRIQESEDYSYVRASIVIACACTLGFLAKPTTGVGLALTSGLWIVASKLTPSKKVRILGMIGLVGLTSLLLHSLFFENGPEQLYHNLKRGAELAWIQGSGYEFSKLIENAYLDLSSIIVVTSQYLAKTSAVAAAIATSFCLFSIRSAWSDTGLQFVTRSAMPCLLISAFIELYTADLINGGPNSTNLGSLTLAIAWIAVLMCTLCCLILSITEKNEDAFPSLRSVIGIFLFCVALSASFGFGSNNGLLRQMSFASMFLFISLILSCSIMDKLTRANVSLPICSMFICLFTYLVMSSAINQPYRTNGSLYLQTEEISFLGARGKLRVEPATAEYVADLRSLAASTGWKKRDTLIDLTGGSPGALVALGAKFLGSPAVLGAYPGSDELGYQVWANVDQSSLLQAWILLAPDGVRTLSPTLPIRLQLPFPQGYQLVGSVKTGHRQETQYLYKPL